MFCCIVAGKGFWSELLGVGDFYYELGVQIIEVCMATSHRNGGRSHVSCNSWNWTLDKAKGLLICLPSGVNCLSVSTGSHGNAC